MAWLATALIGQPIYSFLVLRRQVVRLLVQYEFDTGDSAQSSQWLQERTNIYRLTGSELIAFAASEFVVPKLLNHFGFQVIRAGICLTKLASLSPGNSERKNMYDGILNGLRLTHWIF